MSVVHLNVPYVRSNRGRPSGLTRLYQAIEDMAREATNPDASIFLAGPPLARAIRAMRGKYATEKQLKALDRLGNDACSSGERISDLETVRMLCQELQGILRM